MKIIKDIFLCLFYFILLYYAVASITFRLRHPWATETETLIHPHEILFFERVSPEEWRPIQQ